MYTQHGTYLLAGGRWGHPIESLICLGRYVAATVIQSIEVALTFSQGHQSRSYLYGGVGGLPTIGQMSKCVCHVVY